MAYILFLNFSHSQTTKQKQSEISILHDFLNYSNKTSLPNNIWFRLCQQCCPNVIGLYHPHRVTVQEAGQTLPLHSALSGCISAGQWHAGCRENMRVSLVKCRSCRTGCSCTAETGICMVPEGAVRNTWGTAPSQRDGHKQHEEHSPLI